MVVTALEILAEMLDEAFKMLVFAVASVEPSELEAFSTFVFVVVTFVPIVASVEPSEVEARSV